MQTTEFHKYALYTMQSTLQTIGLTLRQARQASVTTQAALAQSLRMSRATISGIENGTVREIGVRKLIALCAALGLELTVRPQGRRPTLQELRAEQRAGKIST
jgi:transcriptional regulator with XRE-family HTH domain